MRVLFVSSEAHPLAKTGGLADVSAALPAALADLGVDVQLIIPGYPKACDTAIDKTICIDLGDPLGWGDTRLMKGRTPDTGLPVWLVDCPSLFRRAGGLYQGPDGREWPDNAQRFALLNHAAAQVALGGIGVDWQPQVVHANDWQAGLLPVFLGARADRPATLFTIHNMAFQGLFPEEVLPMLGLSREVFHPGGLEFYGKLSFLKAGIRFSDRLTTVSPMYAREILTRQYGCGLDDLLRTRVKDLDGILNGVEYSNWDPSRDPLLAVQYDAGNLAGKKVCKAALQYELGLDVRTDTPVVAFVNRLTEQKMADVVLEALPEMILRGVQFVLHGEGDKVLEESAREIAGRRPAQISVHVGYDEALAHRIHAGADLALCPARFEPCGLTPLYAMRYGQIPLVRQVGGLADMVVDVDEGIPDNAVATGFGFEHATVSEMVNCLDRALALYRDPVRWQTVQRNAMRQDFSWDRAAWAYLRIYRELAGISEPGLERIGPRIAASDTEHRFVA